MDSREIHERILEICRRKAHVVGFNPTGIDRLSVVMRTTRGEKRSFNAPYLALVLQGRKHTVIGEYEFTYGPGDSVVTCIDAPSVTYVEEASPQTPFISVVLELDRNLLAELIVEHGKSVRHAVRPSGMPFAVAKSSDDISLNFLRLLELSEQEDKSILEPILLREVHARLLLGIQGNWLREVCAFGTRTNQISKAVEKIKENFASQISMEALAKEVGMSQATFHRHFKALTGFSPNQYQKLLRLYEARRLLASGKSTASASAYKVGYASTSQFTNDYKAFFGITPTQEIRA